MIHAKAAFQSEHLRPAALVGPEDGVAQWAPLLVHRHKGLPLVGDAQRLNLANVHLAHALADRLAGASPPVFSVLFVPRRLTTASGQLTATTGITVTTAKADNVARGTATIDQTDFSITAAAGSGFDNAVVKIAKLDMGLAKSTSGSPVTITDASGDTVTMDIALTGNVAGISNLDNLSVVVTTNAAADSATFDVGTKQLRINIDSGDAVTERDGAAIAALINGYQVGGVQVFTASNANQTGGGIEAGAFAVTNGSLVQEQAWPHTLPRPTS